jgi:hypothetical protein
MSDTEREMMWDPLDTICAHRKPLDEQICSLAPECAAVVRETGARPRPGKLETA